MLVLYVSEVGYSVKKNMKIRSLKYPATGKDQAGDWSKATAKPAIIRYIL
jgi:hypothetical protein